MLTTNSLNHSPHEFSQHCDVSFLQRDASKAGDAEPAEKPPEVPQKKPRNIDFFMEELKREQELREQREKERAERGGSAVDSSPLEGGRRRVSCGVGSGIQSIIRLLTSCGSRPY